MNKDKFVNASGLSAAFKTFLREAKKIFIARSSLGEGFSVDASGKINVEGGGGGEAVTDHEQLLNRDAADQHPISAITNLETELNSVASRPMTSEEILQIMK